MLMQHSCHFEMSRKNSVIAAYPACPKVAVWWISHKVGEIAGPTPRRP
jgi:hypothetical protein